MDQSPNAKIYHFQRYQPHPRRVKLTGSLHDYQHLRHDAQNLAAYLYMLEHFHANRYDQIRKIVLDLLIPFFDDFVLRPREINPDECTIQLMWQQKDSDYPFLASQLSDGSLRFIMSRNSAFAT